MLDKDAFDIEKLRISCKINLNTFSKIKLVSKTCLLFQHRRMSRSTEYTLREEFLRSDCLPKQALSCEVIHLPKVQFFFFLGSFSCQQISQRNHRLGFCRRQKNWNFLKHQWPGLKVRTSWIPVSFSTLAMRLLFSGHRFKRR